MLKRPHMSTQCRINGDQSQIGATKIAVDSVGGFSVLMGRAGEIPAEDGPARCFDRVAVATSLRRLGLQLAQLARATASVAACAGVGAGVGEGANESAKATVSAPALSAPTQPSALAIRESASAHFCVLASVLVLALSARAPLSGVGVGTRAQRAFLSARPFARRFGASGRWSWRRPTPQRPPMAPAGLPQRRRRPPTRTSRGARAHVCVRVGAAWVDRSGLCPGPQTAGQA